MYLKEKSKKTESNVNVNSTELNNIKKEKVGTRQ